MTEKEILIEDTAVQSTANYEYNTLMRLLGVSVSKHLMDEHFTLVWANNYFYELLGWPKEESEATFHNHPDLYFTGDGKKEWDELVEAVTEALATHQNGYSLVSRLRRKNGEYIWVKYTATFSDEYINGTQVSYTVITNIDDQIRVQKEQSITYNNLPGFVAKFRIEDDWFQFLDANDRFRNFFDIQKETELSYGLTNIETDRNRIVFGQNIPRMRKGQPVHFTLEAKDRSGGNVWLQVNADCIEWANGIPLYLVIYIDITDITEQRELQKQLEERSNMLHDALEAAERANKSKSEFLSHMSHDIRTPMNAILGMTSIAATHLYDPERIQDCLNKIDVSSRLLLSLINEVLDMSKIESGKIVLAEEEVNIADLVEGVVTMIQPQINDKALTFNTYADNITHENVIGDMQRLQQLLLNLLSNAAKYTPKNGNISLEISEVPSETAERSCYRFTVTDTGIGMKPEFLKRVFEPFERADDAAIRSIQGTGLGLSICKSITELMGGTIHVESTYGQGSKFIATLYLPVQEDIIDDSALSGLKVLVVDDDETLCRNTCEHLKELGMIFDWSNDGWSAIEKVKKAHEEKHDYFAVIIDYKMPGLDGIETTRLIREKIGQDIPVIIISAYDMSDQVDEARQVGANGFIAKPLFRSRLAYKLKQFVSGEMAQQPIEWPMITGSYENKRILLVEDNLLNQEIATEILSNTGVSVDTADNGKEAVELIEKSPSGTYDLIFMDMQMPIMDGCTAAKKIRALPQKYVKKIPIIAMTANAFEDDRQKTREAGMDGHLSKPIDMKQLQQVLQKWLL